MADDNNNIQVAGTQGHEDEKVSVGGLKATLQKFKTDLLDAGLAGKVPTSTYNALVARVEAVEALMGDATTPDQDNIINKVREMIAFFANIAESDTLAGLLSSLETMVRAQFEYVTTLNAAPTSSTLTYTIGTTTYNFKVGDEVRVADQNAPSDNHGYIYYKLFDLVTEGNVTTAYWNLVGSGTSGGSSYTPTLSDTPTESTLTYTKDGKTYAFEIGQFCRVADASAPLGYKFYQLFDIAQNGTVAKWNAYATKIPSEYTAPTPKTLTYNTEAQALLNAGSSDDGTIEYSADGTNWSTTIPTGTDAGTYNVYWRLNGDAQHQDVNATLISVTIAPKEVASPTITLSDDSYTYDGTAKEPTVTAKDGDDVIPSTDYTVTYSNNTNAGTATVEVEDNGGNYAFEGSVTFTISKANGSVTTIPASRGVTYNGNAQIVADAGAGTGTMMYRFGNTGEFSSSIPTLTDAGEYTLYYYAAESANYNQSQTGSVEVTVAKAASVYTAPTAKTLTYTGSAQDLLNAGSTSDGTIQYSGDGGTTWSTTIPQGTNADDYAPQWKLIGDSNHNDVSAITINVSIAKANPTYTAPTAKTLTYNGNAQDLVNVGTSNDGTISYSSDNENWGSSIPQGTNAGSHTVYWKLAGDANHNDVASTAISVSIAKVTPTVVAPTAKTGLTYNTQAQELLNAGSTNWGTLKYSSDGTTYSTTIPSETNAGTYTLYYKVEGDSNINDITPIEISVTIAKADPTYTAPTAKSLTPTGSVQELVNAGVSSDGTFNYSLDNETWSTSIPQGTNAGVYTVYWKLVGDSNHNDVASTSIIVIMATVVAPTSKSGLVYNGSAQELANAGSTDFGTLQYSLDNENWSTSIPSGTNAGDYTLYYRVESNGNTGVILNIDCNIAKINHKISFYGDDNGYDYVEIDDIRWATKNVGANSPTDLGNYYMFASGTTQYDNSSYTYSGTDRPIPLSRDTARLVMGGDWCTPDKSHYARLIYYTTFEMTTVNGVNGAKFTDKNGNYLFLPSGGQMRNNTLEYQEQARYWTSTDTYSHGDGVFVRFSTSAQGSDGTSFRYGLLVRGVMLPTYNKFLSVGSTDTVQVFKEGTPTIIVSSSNIDVATISGTTITCVGDGTTTITVTAIGDENHNDTSISYVLEVIPQIVDLGLPSGVKWAGGNIVQNGSGGYKIGKLTDYGAYVSYGNTAPHFASSSADKPAFDDGYNWSNSNTNAPYVNTTGAALTSSSYPNKDAVFSASSGYDAARQLLGGSWRLPTANNCIELKDNCDGLEYCVQGIFGVFLISKINGNKIFLAAGGYGVNTQATQRHYIACMQTSSLYSSTQTYYYYSTSTIGTSGYVTGSWRYRGQVVRPVQ